MKRIKLVETKRGREILETTPRYDVQFDGQVIGQLYFNMTGFTGCYLPTPEGGNLYVGEVGITKWRKVVAELNREFANENA